MPLSDQLAPNLQPFALSPPNTFATTTWVRTILPPFSDPESAGSTFGTEGGTSFFVQETVRTVACHPSPHLEVRVTQEWVFEAVLCLPCGLSGQGTEEKGIIVGRLCKGQADPIA